MTTLLRRLATRSAMLAVLLTLGLIAGFASVALGLGAQTAPSPAANEATTNWPTNARGQTYGSAALATCPEDEPDLILVLATNGKVGYVSRVEAQAVDGSSIKTPEEALAWQATEGQKAHALPVYDVDGTTVVGEFVIEPGTLVEIPEPLE